SRNSLSAEEVSEHITSACGNSSRMLSFSAKVRYSFCSALYLATIAGSIFGWKVTIQRHSPVRDRRAISSYSTGAALQDGENVEWERTTGGVRTGHGSSPSEAMNGSILGKPVSATEKWPSFAARAPKAAVSRGPVVQYRSKKPRM